jgi:hypothetical protein
VATSLPKKAPGFHSNSNGSAFKLGGSSSMTLYPSMSVDEVSSDSEDGGDEDMLQEDD